MKVAFDVKGTLYGERQGLVLKLFDVLQKAGHEMFVWSNSYQYATDAVKDLNLPASPMLKFGKWERKDEQMDLCIEDDHSQEWLGSKRIIFVDDRAAIVALIKEYSDAKSEE